MRGNAFWRALWPRGKLAQVWRPPYLTVESASMIVLRSTREPRGSRLPRRRGGRARPAQEQDVYKPHTLAQPAQYDRLRPHISQGRCHSVCQPGDGNVRVYGARLRAHGHQMSRSPGGSGGIMWLLRGVGLIQLRYWLDDFS